jgi:large subunit ribosomal protein L9
MEIILLEKIDNIGAIGDRVKVKSGFARNYLIPKGKATLATPENIAKFEARRVEIEQRAAGELDAARQRAKIIEGLRLKIEAQAGPEGRLFGSIGTGDIVDACAALGVEVERSEVRMPNGPLRTVGEHEVDFHLHTDVNVTLMVTVDGGDIVQHIDVAEDDGEAAESDDAD